MSWFRVGLVLCVAGLVTGCGSSSTVVLINDSGLKMQGTFERDYTVGRGTSYVHRDGKNTVGSLIIEQVSSTGTIDTYVQSSTYPLYEVTKTKDTQTDCDVSYSYALSEFVDDPVNNQTMYLLTILVPGGEKHTLVSYLTSIKKKRSRVLDDWNEGYGCAKK